jgi:LPXTG-motif cell wall-anchored protein
MTNNTDRGKEDNAGPDAANPRPDNSYGHIIEVTEKNDNHAATTFTWDIFLLCGDPDDPSTYFAGFPKDQVSPIANPDNITFDQAGNLWITTDGQNKSLKLNDGFYAVPVAGTGRGHVQQFFSGVAGCEVTGPAFTPNNRTLFLAVQHPGEGGTFEKPISTWPDRTGQPRPSVIAIRSTEGKPVGQVPDDGAHGTLPTTGVTSALPGAWAGAAGLFAAATGAIIRRRIAMQAQRDEAE